MGNGSGVSRGDRNRNARLARLRALVPMATRSSGSIWPMRSRWSWSPITTRRCWRVGRSGAGLGIWVPRWTGRPGGLRRKGFAGVTVSCEPTGHRWRVLGQLAADRSMPFVCVQPMLTSWSRRAEDLTFDKTDEKDAVLIARLTAQLRCYEPEPVDETWARLRHLGARREQLITETSSQVQQMRDLLECVWPAALDTAQQPFRSRTWIAALAVIVDRDGGDLARTRRLGPARFEHAVRREITQAGRAETLPADRRATCSAALADPAGVTAHRRRRAGTGAAAARATGATPTTRLADTETRMVAVLDELEPDRAGHLDPRHLRGRRRRDPGPDRRPAPVRHRPRPGQTRRPRAAGETVRHLHRPHQTHRPRPTRPAAGGLARRLGRPTRQPRLRRPLSRT